MSPREEGLRAAAGAGGGCARAGVVAAGHCLYPSGMKTPTDLPGGSDLFGATFACTCGRTHTIEPREVHYGDDALERLPEICARAAGTAGRAPTTATAAPPAGPAGHPLPSRARGSEGAPRRVVVLEDVRTREVAGREAARVLAAARWQVRETIVPDPPGPHGDKPAPRHARDRASQPASRSGTTLPVSSPVCDDVTKAALEGEIEGAALVVAVGSGVINDLGKWLAFDAGIPYVSFATAVSMTGYASANVAPTVAGVKTLVRARPPAAVVASPRILCEAPYELTASGLGDALAKIVSSTDWYLNHRLFGDFYCQRAVGLIGDSEPLYMDQPERLVSRNPAAVGALFETMLLVGVSMTMAGTSSPASGGEHLVSHALDMMSSVDAVAHDLHGRQVGVGTVLAAAVYERVLALESPRFADPGDDVDGRFWGPLAGEVAEHYAEKRRRLGEAVAALSAPGAWNELRGRLASMVRPPSAVRECLCRGGAAQGAADIRCDRDRLLAAFRHAHEIRSRFTVLDLARLCGVLPGAYEEIVDRWAR